MTYTRKITKQKIISNKAFCLKCHTIIESKHRHDFSSCKCGALAVDGGRDYLRRVGGLYMLELSVYEECDYEYHPDNFYAGAESNHHTVDYTSKNMPLVETILKRKNETPSV